MPLPLSAEETAMLLARAAPIDKSRQPEFLSAVTAKLEAQGPAAVGPGAVHRVAREILGGFWEPAAGSARRQVWASRAPELSGIVTGIVTQTSGTRRNQAGIAIAAFC
ncbi:MAG: hypothetical protein WA397_02175 [Roseiarcus sp.]